MIFPKSFMLSAITIFYIDGKKIMNIKQLIQQNRKAYIWLNVLYFGLTIISMVLISSRPDLESSFRNWVKSNFNPELMSAVAQGLVMKSMILIFINNFLYSTIFAMSLPSLIIPFWGLLIGIFRSLLWGFALSPSDPTFRLRLFAQIPTWLLEGEAYVLAMFAVFILWRNFFLPRSAGVNSRTQGYILGLRQTLPLYTSIFFLLVLGAIYETLTSIYLIPWLITLG